jgi:hypothetical protein
MVDAFREKNLDFNEDIYSQRVINLGWKNNT